MHLRRVDLPQPLLPNNTFTLSVKLKVLPTIAGRDDANPFITFALYIILLLNGLFLYFFIVGVIVVF